MTIAMLKRCDRRRCTGETMTEKELAEILRRNPELRIVDDGRPQKRPPIPVSSDKERLVETFADLWLQLGGQALVRELRFDVHRRWRFDFAHEGARVAIEINGGVWSGGRHVRGAGYLRDRVRHGRQGVARYGRRGMSGYGWAGQL